MCACVYACLQREIWSQPNPDLQPWVEINWSLVWTVNAEEQLLKLVTRFPSF